MARSAESGMVLATARSPQASASSGRPDTTIQLVMDVAARAPISGSDQRIVVPPGGQQPVLGRRRPAKHSEKSCQGVASGTGSLGLSQDSFR